MSDAVDNASKVEQMQRDIALKNLRPKVEKPLVINGVRVCLTCEEPIFPVRIVVLPNAVRCIDCQSTVEQLSNQYRK